MDEWWTLYVDFATKKMGSGVGIVLEGPRHIRIEQSLHFEFKASNNQAECEALVVGLLLAKDMRARKVKCRSDSQITVSQLKEEYQVKDLCNLDTSTEYPP